jgi:hypothetical protein
MRLHSLVSRQQLLEPEQQVSVSGHQESIGV